MADGVHALAAMPRVLERGHQHVDRAALQEHLTQRLARFAHEREELHDRLDVLGDKALRDELGEELDVRRQQPGDAVDAGLAASLAGHPTLASLELWNVELDDDGALAVGALGAPAGDGGGNAALRELNLGRNLLLPQTQQALEQALTTYGTEKLSLTDAQELLSQIEPDENGLINYVEFVNMMTQS